MCLTGPPPVCEKLKMKPCYADREVMTMFGKNFLCDTKTDGGGWILMQRRIRPGVNFKENWQTYKEGFGTLSGDFWIGLDFIYLLMTQHINAHNNSQFYTIDRSDGYNCAAHYEAGWWFNRCYTAYLNGVWVETSRYEGIHWDALGKEVHTLQSVEMKLRKKNY
ncbi:angiopoietin-related protein 2-like [Physella acuta]|uniref:angiopoietin-related protein 2-like n=1 Tax=Physella acuta TaxID=109671 RepID=UPI0027DE8AAA|nr:angiopoietin-related protein 2-like [Physella acuta]